MHEALHLCMLQNILQVNEDNALQSSKNENHLMVYCVENVYNYLTDLIYHHHHNP